MLNTTINNSLRGTADVEVAEGTTAKALYDKLRMEGVPFQPKRMLAERIGVNTI